MDAEKIILTKNFYELSPSEKEAIRDYAQNETDFNEIKSFLQATQRAFNQQKIQVSADLNNSILNHLHQPVEQKKTWLNGLYIFLFPENKSFYQYPAFQLGLASILLIFIFNVMTNKNISNDSLAVNDKENNQPLIINNESVDEISLNQQKEKQYLDSSNFLLPSTSIIKTELKSIDEPADREEASEEELYLEEVTEVNEAEDDILHSTTEAEAPTIASQNVSMADLETIETDEKTKKANGGIFSEANTNAYSSNSKSRAKTIKSNLSIKNTSELIDLFFISE